MDGEGADRIVNSCIVECRNSEDNDDATHESGNPRTHQSEVAATGSHAHQSGQNAVDDHGEIRLFRGDRGDHRGANGTASCAKGGGYGDVRHPLIHRELGAWVEAVPANPKDQAAQGGNRHVVARDGLRLATNVFTNAGA